MPTTLVSGRVLDDRGNPVGGAVVMFSSSPVPVPDIAEVVRPDGRFALSAPAPGRYRITVRGPGGESAEVEVDVGPASPAEVLVVLPGGGGP